MGGSLKEVVVASASDLASLSTSMHLSEVPTEFTHNHNTDVNHIPGRLSRWHGIDRSGSDFLHPWCGILAHDVDVGF